MRILVAAVLAACAALPAVADETEGLVLAFDRQARLIVLTDKSVWTLPDTLTAPEDLGRGDRVLFEYEAEGEDGLTEITAMTRLSVALGAGADGGS
ncbi:hypothetical protein EI983_03595 [Roseovarius faecimaris]|uniref:DUF1344 domain-containing protein n=1 Tax=Roseovarius faecimaris TaxID=2494550 RepID=A0A6I6IM88_9RHOB|nr:hypothetical protein [Roseovarius faecimaris]QGX97412.1 hypothetical protein EI983_03595 [Roseovarius faecimaris]